MSDALSPTLVEQLANRLSCQKTAAESLVISRKQERAIFAVTAESPCVGHCTTVLGDDVCRSCLRTFEEITRWVQMDDQERCAVNRRIAMLKN